jgi:hypothetical protein
VFFFRFFALSYVLIGLSFVIFLTWPLFYVVSILFSNIPLMTAISFDFRSGKIDYLFTLLINLYLNLYLYECHEYSRIIRSVKLHSLYVRGSLKVPGLLRHQQFGAR